MALAARVTSEPVVPRAYSQLELGESDTFPVAGRARRKAGTASLDPVEGDRRDLQLRLDILLLLSLSSLFNLGFYLIFQPKWLKRTEIGIKTAFLFSHVPVVWW